MKCLFSESMSSLTVVLVERKIKENNEKIIHIFEYKIFKNITLISQG